MTDTMRLTLADKRKARDKAERKLRSNPQRDLPPSHRVSTGRHDKLTEHQAERMLAVSRHEVEDGVPHALSRAQLAARFGVHPSSVNHAFQRLGAWKEYTEARAKHAALWYQVMACCCPGAAENMGRAAHRKVLHDMGMDREEK